ncbi:ABC transporter ATP-binding protein [Roseomonas sp. OT10]|uniref:ABC transporter ATP-binding protein n=1 Tax=Roseomonas cutis TaxID=2897332 RepID=UPI001E5E4EC9|nr:ABC transporter ATP-binding protein [Roseomonas sp. OT10]UFN48115.1 ABC transporter ATP-binding protein [Roseomonas sp. OT10]
MGEPMTVEPILRVRGLETHFSAPEGTIRAVDGVDLDIFAGRTLGVVGESGCGKSVTARSILGIVERPGRVVRGSMVLRREDGSQLDLAGLPPDSAAMRNVRGREIALVFQEPMASFSQYHTVGNQIMEPILLHMGLTKRQARARAIELLDMVGVPYPARRVDEYPFQLSGGLRQRVMIAMALACDPRILIADEPTTALDVTTQAQVLDLLRDLQEKRGLAIILITHDMGVIAEMAHDVTVMYLGRAVESGPVRDIFAAPRHPYTRALLRSIPTVQAKPRTRLPTISGSIPHPFNRPGGCPYHPRCAERLGDICRREEPAATGLAHGGHVRCFLESAQVETAAS